MEPPTAAAVKTPNHQPINHRTRTTSSMHLTWTIHTAEHAADLSLTLDDIQAMLTSATSHREHLNGPIYAYTSHGIRTIIDTHTCTVLRVEYDLNPDILNDWRFTPQAIDDCKHFNTTPAAIITSLDDAQPHPAAHMRTIYRNRLYDILANESKRLIVTIKPSGTLTTTSTHDTRRITGGTPTGSIPSTTTELLTRARRAGFGVSLAGSGHHKIWASGTPRQGRSVTIPTTASDHRSLLNSVMTIRSVLGVDLRKY